MIRDILYSDENMDLSTNSTSQNDSRCSKAAEKPKKGVGDVDASPDKTCECDENTSARTIDSGVRVTNLPKAKETLNRDIETSRFLPKPIRVPSNPPEVTPVRGYRYPDAIRPTPLYERSVVCLQPRAPGLAPQPKMPVSMDYRYYYGRL